MNYPLRKFLIIGFIILICLVAINIFMPQKGGDLKIPAFDFYVYMPLIAMPLFVLGQLLFHDPHFFAQPLPNILPGESFVSKPSLLGNIIIFILYLLISFVILWILEKIKSKTNYN